MTSRRRPSVATGEQVHVLREFALLADGERGALVGPDGNIVWMCAPRWHDDAVFSRLIGGVGEYSVTPSDRYTWGGSYEDGTLIWRSRWITNSSIIESHEALAMPGDLHRVVVLRRVKAVKNQARVAVVLDVRAGFGRHSMRELKQHDDGRWTATSGDLAVRWSGCSDAVVASDGRLFLELEIEAGHEHDLVLEIGDQALPDPLGPDELWEETWHHWRHSVPRLESSAAPRDSRLAAAVLTGLASREGGMVAAATMSLPERSYQNRSFDYRYAWIRDQCYAGLAAAAAGMDSLFTGTLDFVTGRLLADGENIKPAYRVDGGPVPDEQRIPLPGYPGGRDIAGNWVNSQFQLDSLGDTLRLFAAAGDRGMLDADRRKALELAVQVIEKRWDEPDAGIWELESDWWTHSRLACVAGLRRVSQITDPGDAGRLLTLADTILAKTTTDCLSPEGFWQRSPSKPETDTALLWPAVCGAVPPSDPRTQATLSAVIDRLTVDGYAYRFAPDDRPLGQAEGAFLLCGFFISLAHAQQGDRVLAFRWFERNRAACGTPGLFTEEYDVQQRQLRGNFPQAFVHAALLQAGLDLETGECEGI